MTLTLVVNDEVDDTIDRFGHHHFFARRQSDNGVGRGFDELDFFSIDHQFCLIQSGYVDHIEVIVRRSEERGTRKFRLALTDCALRLALTDCARVIYLYLSANIPLALQVHQLRKHLVGCRNRPC